MTTGWDNANSKQSKEVHGDPLQDLTELAALPQASLEDKEQRYVEDENNIYHYDATATSGDVAPDDQTGGTGFWVALSAGGGGGTEDPLEAHIELASTTNQGQGTRNGQTTFDGAIFRCNKAATINTLHMRVTGRTGSPTGAFAIYQQADGNTGEAALIATVTGIDLSSTGNKEISLTEFDLVEGFFYVLWGRDSGSGGFTARTYVNSGQDLLDRNVPEGLSPVKFTTTIPCNVAAPSTFDPRESVISGGDAVPAGNTNTALIIRLTQ